MRKIIFKSWILLLTILLVAGSQQLFGQLVTNTSTSLTYSTIQAAIDDPLTLNGHTLTLDPGIYVENIVINKQLTINGPKVGVDGNDISRGTGEAIIYPARIQLGDITYIGGRIFNITADNITIDGITLNGDNPLLSSGYSANGADIDVDFAIVSMVSPWLVVPDPVGDNIIIRNNIIKNFRITAITMWNGYDSTIAKAGQIKNNKIQNTPDGPAIYLAQNYYASVENNTISDASEGILVYFFWLNKTLSATGTLKNNTITLKTDATTPVQYPYVAGIQIYFIYNGIVDAWAVENNVLTNNSTRSTGSRGIDFNYDNNPTDLTINNNNISGFESGYGLRNSSNSVGGLTPPTTSLTITGGTVSNCSYGIKATNLMEFFGNINSSIYNINQVTVLNSTTAALFIDDESLNPINTIPSFVSVVASNCKFSNNPTGVLLTGNYAYDTLHENDLSGNNVYAINNLSPNNVDASCNWYGNASGPTNPANPAGTGGNVSANVSFSPWLINGADNDPVTPGFQPVPGSCVNSTIAINCPENITRNTGRNCQRSINTADPVITLLNNTTLTQLTWTLTGATSGNSRNRGINYLGTRNFNVGVTIVTYTATNSTRFTSTCSFTVTVVDNISPTINCPSDRSGNAGRNNCSMIIRVPNPSINDNCSISSLTWEMTGATTGNSASTGINYVGRQSFNVGVTTITYTVKDAANNTATCSFNVRVRGSNNCNPTVMLTNNVMVTDEVMKKVGAKQITNQAVKIYPNPSNQFFTLETSLATNERMELRVFDSNGKLVEQLSSITSMPVRFGSDLHPGLYLVKIIRDKDIATIKVVKQ
jgi:hypothetical protein